MAKPVPNSIRVGWLIFYRWHEYGQGYQLGWGKWIGKRSAEYRAKQKHLTDAEVMAELHAACAEYLNALLSGVGVDEAAKWLRRWDRIVALEEQQ